MNNLRTFSNHNITGCFPELTKKKKKKNQKDYIILLNLDSIPLFPKKPKRKKKKKLLRHIDGNVLSRYMLLVDLYFNPIKQIKYIYIYIYISYPFPWDRRYIYISESHQKDNKRFFTDEWIESILNSLANQSHWINKI